MRLSITFTDTPETNNANEKLPGTGFNDDRLNGYDAEDVTFITGRVGFNCLDFTITGNRLELSDPMEQFWNGETITLDAIKRS